MRTGWEILPDGEFCEANCLSKEGTTTIRFALYNSFLEKEILTLNYHWG